MDLIIGTDSDTKSRRRKAIKTSTGASTDMLNMVKMAGKGRRAAQLYMPASRMLLHCGAYVDNDAAGPAGRADCQDGR